jgi:hypothetical protein
MKKRYLDALRAELAEIEYCIGVRNEQLAKLYEEKAHYEALIKRYEGEIGDKGDTR